jgi:predicted O-linked N-acetylglucosamine transferase (SPINDLY family)
LQLAAALEAIASSDWERARRLCDRLLAEFRGSGEVQHAAALVCWGENDLAAALAHLDAALALAPEESSWHNDRGVVCLALRRYPEAAASFERCLALDPADRDARRHYARALMESAAYREARVALEGLAESEPERAQNWRELGCARAALEDDDGAVAALRRALEIDPALAPAHEQLCLVYGRLRRAEDALDHARRLARLQPDAAAFARLAIAHWDAGDIEQALEARDRAHRCGVRDPQTHSALLYLSLFDPAQSGATLLRMHREWTRAHAPRAVSKIRLKNLPQPERRLKIGYVTARLFATPTSYFMTAVLQNHDRGRFETYLYDTNPDARAPAAGLAGAVRDVRGWSDERIAETVRQDGIDILCDLLGHHSFNRLRVFAMRAAPVQVAYPNYASTRGLEEIDYFLTDRWTTPGGTEDEYAEEVYRLPAGALVYAPPECAPEISPLPALENGRVTFGVFQRAAKLNPGAWDAIARVMLAAPGSRLLFHHADPAFDSEGSSARQGILRALARRAVEPERVAFCGRRDLRAHLETLARADVALDTFPYHGQTTTCECLWMGVPVITLAGRSHVARVGAGLLQQAGMGAWVASSMNEYVALAAGLARDLTALAAARAELRHRLAVSPLTHVAARTREIEQAYRWMWTRWCSGNG